MADAAITVEDVRKRYGDKEALDGLDLAVARGTVHGVLGPNGAGKTTLVRIMSTLLRESLTAYDQKPDVLSAGLGLMVDLGREEVLGLLEERIRAIQEWRRSVTEYYTPEEGPGQLGHIGEIMNFWVHSANTGAEWTRALIERIRGGAYTFAGEGEPFVGVLGEGEENPYGAGEPHPGDRD